MSTADVEGSHRSLSRTSQSIFTSWGHPSLLLLLFSPLLSPPLSSSKPFILRPGCLPSFPSTCSPSFCCWIHEKPSHGTGNHHQLFQSLSLSLFESRIFRKIVYFKDLSLLDIGGIEFKQRDDRGIVLEILFLIRILFALIGIWILYITSFWSSS